MIDQTDDLRPWVPEGMRVFRVGDRVRVRLSGECEIRQQRFDALTMRPLGIGSGHRPEENGRTGVVRQPPRDVPPTNPTHNVLVWFDEPFLHDGGRLLRRGAGFAPAELELIAAAPDHERSEQ